MSQILPSIKDRVLYFAEKQESNKQIFFRKTGLKYSNFTGKSKNSDLSSKYLAEILLNYPQANSDWFLTGRGNMLRQEVTVQNQKRKTKDAIIDYQEVPLYNLEATAGLVELFKSNQPAEILESIKIPNIPRCDGAIHVTGDSMYPLLKSGDIILYKQVPIDIHNIFYGEMYLLGIIIDDTDELVTVKYVQKSDLGSRYIKLVSQNSHHQSKDILLSNITAMAMVKVSIRVNTMF